MAYIVFGVAIFAAPQAQPTDNGLTLVSWGDLGPENTAVLSPVELTKGMTLQQKIDFQVLRDYAAKGTGRAVDPTVTTEEAAAARLRMSAAGIDSVALMTEWSSRQTQLFSAQLELKTQKFDGANVALQGYLIKLFNEAGLPDGFLLVATPGACSHTPVPAYQAVIVRNVDYEPNIPVAFDPLAAPGTVWVSGTINVGMQSGTAFVVDGMSTVSSAYEIEDAEIVINPFK